MSCKCGNAKLGACESEFQYGVKAVSGTWNEPQPKGAPPPVAPGTYYTAINVHNPSKCDSAIVRWKIAEALPLKAVKPIDRRPFQLRPDEAIEIDNPQILIPPKINLKGFVVLHSQIELDVVAVYTGTQGSKLVTFHTERVTARCVPVCEDLELNISTGVADWQLISPQPGAAYILTPPSSLSAPNGSQWVGSAYTDGSNAPANGPEKTFELGFDLCYGFRPPSLSIEVKVDDSAILTLNGTNLLSTTNFTTVPYSVLTTFNVPPNLFVAGRNILHVKLSNTGAGSNGFALAGLLRVSGGRCPCHPLPLRPRRQEGIPAPFATDAEVST